MTPDEPAIEIITVEVIAQEAEEAEARADAEERGEVEPMRGYRPRPATAEHLARAAADAEAELAAIDAGEVEAPTPVRARQPKAENEVT